MHRLSTAFVLGYHGCDAAVAKRLIDGDRFKASNNDYDWLGSGIYFWEANPRRGLDFAGELKARGSRIKKPAVVGAVIELGYCLDLLTSSAVEAVKAAYEDFEKLQTLADVPLPENAVGDDLLLRRLDCAVVNHLHYTIDRAGGQPFDSVRGVFFEGGRIYPKSGFRRKTHMQICVRNPDCIKGVFHVPPAHLEGD